MVLKFFFQFRELAWDVMPDLFFYRDPEEAEKEEQARQEALQAAQNAAKAQVPAKVDDTWGGEEMTTDWANEPVPALAAPVAAPGASFTGKLSVFWYALKKSSKLFRQMTEFF